jgi:hypothetical protein
MYPEAMEVAAPSTKATAVSRPRVSFWLQEISRKITMEASTTKTAQMLYSAKRKDSAPAEMAS